LWTCPVGEAAAYPASSKLAFGLLRDIDPNQLHGNANAQFVQALIGVNTQIVPTLSGVKFS
jgi:hypothetical protein